MLNLHVNSNAILKASGSGLRLLNVKSFDKQGLPACQSKAESLMQLGVGVPVSTMIEQNYISDVFEGPGLVIDASTVFMEVNQVKKCDAGGMLVQSSQAQYQAEDELEYLYNFSVVQADMMTLHFNGLYGLLVQDFFGFIQLKKSNIHDNEGYGVQMLN